MLGAIIGDIVGSRFEWDNIKTKDFDFLTFSCDFTDDSVMTLALAGAILEAGGEFDNLGDLAVKHMREVGRPYPACGYGGMFRQWVYSDDMGPYNSFGNGAAMRVSACGFAASSLDEAIMLSRKVTEVTHNHPEGMKGAEATAVCVFLAREGKSIIEVRDYVNEYYYPMDFTLDGIRGSYQFDETCQGTVPQAIMAFLEFPIEYRLHSAGARRLQRSTRIIEPHVNTLYHVTTDVNIVVFDEHEPVCETRIVAEIRNRLDEFLAWIVRRMSLSGKDKLHGSVRVVTEPSHSVEIVQHQCCPLVCCKAAPETDGQYLRVQDGSGTVDDLVGLPTSSALPADTPSHKGNEQVFQGVVRFPQFAGVNAVDSFPVGRVEGFFPPVRNVPLEQRVDLPRHPTGNMHAVGNVTDRYLFFR